MQPLKDVVNALAAPEFYVPLSGVLLVASLLTYRRWTRPAVAAALGAGLIAFLAFCIADPNFWKIAKKPDNLPIFLLLLSACFFTWLAFRQAAVNDERIAKGEVPLEGRPAERERMLVWPDLVYSEFLALIVCSAVLVVWAVVLKAPLEEPASPTVAPNPSKAPWYFLGLQEMLVYFDPWLAGVVFPSLILVGLMAIPYVDRNPKGSGYFTFAERKFAVTMFLAGFLVLWVGLIILGTFLRGPNWNLFGPFEHQDPHKVEALTNINLSEMFWVRLLGRGLPDHWLVRELPGILLVAAYFLVLPAVLARTFMRKMAQELGGVRFGIVAFLFACMLSLPIKMFLRWTLNLKYVVAIQEYFFNI